MEQFTEKWKQADAVNAKLQAAVYDCSIDRISPKELLTVMELSRPLATPSFMKAAQATYAPKLELLTLEADNALCTASKENLRHVFETAEVYASELSLAVARAAIRVLDASSSGLQAIASLTKPPQHVRMANAMRKAANYYFLRNDDNLAQNKLGSLRLFNEYQYDNSSSSGTLTVDKNNGQVQSVVLSEDITTVTFSNFVTSASDGTTTDYQTDTVTLILRQGSTPYTVTMPSGSAYKYAAGSTTVGATANAVTMISVTANYDSISAADQYLITISPEFS